MNNVLLLPSFRFHLIYKYIIFVLFALCNMSIVTHAEWEGYNIALASGENTYFRFCSVCHGKDGEGNGSYAINLTTPPPDLRKLSMHNNSQFPWKRSYESIDGRSKHLAHGTTEMPVWSHLFDLRSWGQEHTQFADVIVRGRIFELLLYLESIQNDGMTKYSATHEE